MGYENLITLEFALVEHFEAAKDVIERVVGFSEDKADR